MIPFVNSNFFKNLVEAYIPANDNLFKPICSNVSTQNVFTTTNVFGEIFYSSEGPTIVISFFIYCFTPHIASYVMYLIIQLYRRYDRGFTNDKRRTKQVLQEDYNEVYLGPEFLIEREYSMVLTILFTVLMYSPAFPIILVFGTMGLMIKYWVDKIMVLRFCRAPPNMDEKLANLVRSIGPYSLVVHLIMAILVYGNAFISPPFSFNDQTNLSDFIYSNSGSTLTILSGSDAHYSWSINWQFLSSLESFFQPHLAFQLVVFALLIGVMFIFELIWKPVMSIMRLCLQDRINKEFISEKNNVNFLDGLATEYVAEKYILALRTKLPDKMQPQKEEVFARIMRIYQNEYEIRHKVTKDKTKFFNGAPFYSIEFDAKYKSKLGTEFVPEIIYVDTPQMVNFT